MNATQIEATLRDLIGDSDMTRNALPHLMRRYLLGQAPLFELVGDEQHLLEYSDPHTTRESGMRLSFATEAIFTQSLNLTEPFRSVFDSSRLDRRGDTVYKGMWSALKTSAGLTD